MLLWSQWVCRCDEVQEETYATESTLGKNVSMSREWRKALIEKYIGETHQSLVKGTKFIKSTAEHGNTSIERDVILVSDRITQNYCDAQSPHQSPDNSLLDWQTNYIRSFYFIFVSGNGYRSMKRTLCK